MPDHHVAACQWLIALIKKLVCGNAAEKYSPESGQSFEKVPALDIG